jgi:hypothetical protein
MDTVCHKQLSFGSLFGKEVIVDFEGGRISSDGGGLLLREIDDRYGLAEKAARCLSDPRDLRRITHDEITLLRQRIFSIALGYEDANDADSLRRDPVLKTISGRLPESSDDLASQPTLCRFENATDGKDLRRLADALMDLYLETHPGPRDLIVIDMDSTDDPTHGRQQLSFFHGYYDQHMYHPLLVFDGIDGFPMAAVLRPGNTHASHRSVSVLKRIIKRLRKAYPRAAIILRADAGFAVPELYQFCERKRIHYTVGLITNDRLKDKAAELLAEAKEKFRETREKQRLFTVFTYRADSWNRYRRVVAKVEYTDQGPNERFVVTNIHLPPQRLYDEIYVLRGDAENRIKELKLELKADRLSCHRFFANQFRLLLHTFAYCLFLLLRNHLRGTELASAQVGTLRVKLLKIGTRVRETSRRIWFHLASGCPYKSLFYFAYQSLKAAPT